MCTNTNAIVPFKSSVHKFMEVLENANLDYSPVPVFKSLVQVGQGAKAKAIFFKLVTF